MSLLRPDVCLSLEGAEVFQSRGTYFVMALCDVGSLETSHITHHITVWVGLPTSR